MEKMEVIGAYLANELIQDGPSVMNTGRIIHVTSPINNAYGQLTFPDSALKWINGKNILLLIATVSSGRALNIALECINYYGGILTGVSALYRSSEIKIAQKVNCLFTADDIPGYKLYDTTSCELCKGGQKLDAIISSEGYTKFE
jgi:orotate phosphoribosyltransferase